MVFCLQADLVFSNATRRDDVLADMQSQINQRPRWGDSVATGYTTPAAQPAITVESRFTARTDLDSLTARLESFATGPRRPDAGSWYAVHDCGHDTVVSCPTPARRVW